VRASLLYGASFALLMTTFHALSSATSDEPSLKAGTWGAFAFYLIGGCLVFGPVMTLIGRAQVRDYDRKHAERSSAASI
jgi:hypothetical protein